MTSLYLNTIQLSSAGQAEFNDISWSSLVKSGDVGTISVKAEVLDETGRTETGATTIVVHKHKIALQILDSSTIVLREGIPARINVCFIFFWLVIIKHICERYLGC